MVVSFCSKQSKRRFYSGPPHHYIPFLSEPAPNTPSMESLHGNPSRLSGFQPFTAVRWIQGWGFLSLPSPATVRLCQQRQAFGHLWTRSKASTWAQWQLEAPGAWQGLARGIIWLEAPCASPAPAATVSEAAAAKMRGWLETPQVRDSQGFLVYFSPNLLLSRRKPSCNLTQALCLFTSLTGAAQMLHCTTIWWLQYLFATERGPQSCVSGWCNWHLPLCLDLLLFSSK